MLYRHSCNTGAGHLRRWAPTTRSRTAASGRPCVWGVSLVRFPGGGRVNCVGSGGGGGGPSCPGRTLFIVAGESPTLPSLLAEVEHGPPALGGGAPSLGRLGRCPRYRPPQCRPPHGGGVSHGARPQGRAWEGRKLARAAWASDLPPVGSPGARARGRALVRLVEGARALAWQVEGGCRRCGAPEPFGETGGGWPEPAGRPPGAPPGRKRRASEEWTWADTRASKKRQAGLRQGAMCT